MNGSALVKCTCKHEYQDQHYGEGRRVASLTDKGEARCSVCGTLHKTHSAAYQTPVKGKK